MVDTLENYVSALEGGQAVGVSLFLLSRFYDHNLTERFRSHPVGMTAAANNMLVDKSPLPQLPLQRSWCVLARSQRSSFTEVYTRAQAYDLILTLRLEVSLIWFSRWNYTKVLYLLVRYLPFVANVLILCSEYRNPSSAIPSATYRPGEWRKSNLDHLLPDASNSTCTNIYKTIGCKNSTCGNCDA